MKNKWKSVRHVDTKQFVSFCFVWISIGGEIISRIGTYKWFHFLINETQIKKMTNNPEPNMDKVQHLQTSKE